MVLSSITILSIVNTVPVSLKVKDELPAGLFDPSL
jgi:hypothetical protein